MDIKPQYDPAEAEARWYPVWMERGYFHADARSGKPPFCVVLPPPNVTGALHIGHAFQQGLQDILIRRARMQGYEALWLPGTDHAGIATQVVVERELRKEGIERREIGREAFLEKVWEWKESYGGRIVEQMKALGNSCDWERLRFTMDEGLSHAVRVAFTRLYEDGLIYRGERLVNWCPNDRTGLSDSEVEYEEVNGEFVTFRYPLSDGSGDVSVATTRVETMLGDTGIAVHPDDERYAAFVGRTVRHPFTGAEVPIVADPVVDREFGTGAVKVTPAHDPNDFEIAQRCGLPLVNIFDDKAELNDNVPERFRGMDRYEARRAVREALVELGLVVGVVKPYPHSVGHCYRCKAEIEPWIAGKQWFVAVERLKGPARQAVSDGRIVFNPPRWARAYDTWMDGLRDWNISRQLWWGHRIPVWYCPDGHETVAVEDPTACAVCGSGEIEQDPDVLDTWFSSQLWPFSTLGWPKGGEDLSTFYPTTVMVTGYEILYLWVARMIMSGIYLAGDVPFREVAIHGLVRDAHGHKMSKSLGNVIDPLHMIERYGADALRFALARMASPEQQNLPLSEESIEASRNFANKIWNASRLVLGAEGKPELPAAQAWTTSERWLLSRHRAALRDADGAFERRDFAAAAQTLHRFVWSEFCDWGLEAEKPRLNGDDAAQKRDAANLLAWVLERTLRALHPIMPFVTEEIWQRLAVGESIVVADWPEDHPELTDADAEAEFVAAQRTVTAVRQFRTDHGIAPRTTLNVTLESPDGPPEASVVESIERMAAVSMSKGEGLAVTVPLDGGGRLTFHGAIDRDRERARFEKKRVEIQMNLERSAKKLANEGFLAKAAPETVAAERAKHEALERQMELIESQLRELG
jgi:valyl-tRNA synthetase